MAKRKRHNPYEIILKLRETEKWPTEELPMGKISRRLEVTEATFYRWCSQLGGIKAGRKEA